MVEQLYPAPEAGFTLRDNRIHRHNLSPNLVSHLLRRQAPRLGRCRGFFVPRACGPIPRPRKSARDAPWMPSSPAACRLFYDFLETLDRSDIGQVQMFQHLRRTPLSPGDASSIARWTCLPPPTPEIVSTCPSGNSWHDPLAFPYFRVWRCGESLRGLGPCVVSHLDRQVRRPGLPRDCAKLVRIAARFNNPIDPQPAGLPCRYRHSRHRKQCSSRSPHHFHCRSGCRET